MRALVTGSAGFLGRHFCAALYRQGLAVVEVDILHDQPSWRTDALDFFRDDQTRFDLAVHCAAVVGGREVIDRRPLGQVLNLALDAAFINWCERTRPHRAVYLSSSAAYPVRLQGPGHRIRLTESMVVPGHCDEPDAGYGWQKLTGERLVAQAQAEGVNLTVVRPFSGYGEDQDDCYPFPAFVARAAGKADPFPIWGSGGQVRDWVHVDDVVGATLALADAGVAGPVNIGTGVGTSMIDLAAMICDAAGFAPVFAPEPSAPTGVEHRVCDPDRMSRLYTPRVSLAEGVSRAVEAGGGR